MPTGENTSVLFDLMKQTVGFGPWYSWLLNNAPLNVTPQSEQPRETLSGMIGTAEWDAVAPAQHNIFQ